MHNFLFQFPGPVLGCNRLNLQPEQEPLLHAKLQKDAVHDPKHLLFPVVYILHHIIQNMDVRKENLKISSSIYGCPLIYASLKWQTASGIQVIAPMSDRFDIITPRFFWYGNRQEGK